LSRLQSHLQHLNPQAVLERGYSITRNAEGHVIRASSEVEPGEGLQLNFAQGTAEVRVETTD
jgi:exodeoxyribonuclease VII large subunit